MTPQSPIDDILTITGINGGEKQYIDHNRAQWWGGGNKLTKIGMRSGGEAPGKFILTITGIHCVLMIPCQNFAGGLQMKKKLTKIGNLPYFGQFGAPPSLFCARPLYPQEVLKVLRVPN